MKRSLKDTVNKKGPAESGMPENVKEVVERYSGMSETELMKALLAETERQKREGRFDRAGVENGMNAILPMLNDVQKKKLFEIMGRIDKQ